MFHETKKAVKCYPTTTSLAFNSDKRISTTDKARCFAYSNITTHETGNYPHKRGNIPTTGGIRQ